MLDAGHGRMQPDDVRLDHHGRPLAKQHLDAAADRAKQPGQRDGACQPCGSGDDVAASPIDHGVGQELQPQRNQPVWDP
jgi:hypothetical protein